MNNRSPFSIRARIKSVGFALAGIGNFIKTEHNARIHLAATLIVIALVIIVHVSRMELIMLAFSVGFVWAAEPKAVATADQPDILSKPHSHDP